MGNRGTGNQNPYPSISVQQKDSRRPERAPDAMMWWPLFTEGDLT